MKFVRGGYCNVPNATARNWGTDYFGTNFDSRYDPNNVFSFEQSIPPA